MAYRYSLNGEYVTKKEFVNAYGKTETNNILKELKESGSYTTIYLNGGLDEVSN